MSQQGTKLPAEKTKRGASKRVFKRGDPRIEGNDNQEVDNTNGPSLFQKMIPPLVPLPSPMTSTSTFVLPAPPPLLSTTMPANEPSAPLVSEGPMFTVNEPNPVRAIEPRVSVMPIVVKRPYDIDIGQFLNHKTKKMMHVDKKNFLDADMITRRVVDITKLPANRAGFELVQYRKLIDAGYKDTLRAVPVDSRRSDIFASYVLTIQWLIMQIILQKMYLSKRGEHQLDFIVDDITNDIGQNWELATTMPIQPNFVYYATKTMGFITTNELEGYKTFIKPEFMQIFNIIDRAKNNYNSTREYPVASSDAAF